VERKIYSVRQLEEKMRILLALIEGGKVSHEKQMELQEHYSWLQREYELLITKR